MGKKVLIGCEESQTVCLAFRNLGFEAYSCDLLPCSGGYPEFHLQMDVFEAVKLKKWDLFIAHPECTRLTVTANKWYKPEYAQRFPNIHKERKDAIDFFMRIVDADIPHKAIENPIGIMSSIYRQPDQIIQPYYFGDAERKATCLWLYGLPKLTYSLENTLFDKKTSVNPEIVVFISGKTMSKYHYDSTKLTKEERRKLRSKTFQGIANAMAEQWSKAI
jgi:hypothetical protein